MPFCFELQLLFSPSKPSFHSQAFWVNGLCVRMLGEKPHGNMFATHEWNETKWLEWMSFVFGWVKQTQTNKQTNECQLFTHSHNAQNEKMLPFVQWLWLIKVCVCVWSAVCKMLCVMCYVNVWMIEWVLRTLAMAVNNYILWKLKFDSSNSTKNDLAQLCQNEMQFVLKR